MKNATTNSSLFDWKSSLKLTFFYILAKLKFVHGWLPETLREQLLISWNNQMFWVAFKSGGKTRYSDYYCRLKEPKSYKPRASVAPEFHLTEEQIRGFYENGYVGPFDLLPPEEMEKLRQYLINSLLKTESKHLSFTAGDYEFDTTGKDGLVASGNRKVTESNKKRINGMNQIDRHLDDDPLMNLFKHPAITERAAQLLGPHIILWRTNFFEVLPGLQTTLHQASTFLSYNHQEALVTPEDDEDLFQLTCWIALTDANKKNGCMMILPGTHKEIYPLNLEEFTQDAINNDVHAYSNLDLKIDYPGELPQPHYIETHIPQIFKQKERKIDSETQNSQTIAVQSFGSF